MDYTVRLRGRGRAEVAAYGLADAEHLVEREIGRLWPEARVDVLEVTRVPADRARIVEEFAIGYRITAHVTADADSLEDARRAAQRQARSRLRGSRYARVEWEK